MKELPQRHCRVVPKDTSHLGGAAVPLQVVKELIADLVSEQLVKGKLSKESQGEINELCQSARAAGTKDVLPFEEALEIGGLNVDCSTCPWGKQMMSNVEQNQELIEKIKVQMKSRGHFCDRECSTVRGGTCIGRAKKDARRPAIVFPNWELYYVDSHPGMVKGIPTDCSFGFKDENSD
ncbi:hypothetical protein A2Z22_00560 [Candidatus Woesebacteria bacterium RBG_16_34_12]|uniref:Uncharacterized protein n=1 Tax=Candidatus Woesebacteria bacterium RBG_16_34_12 TaxID=1802480 RepID=A0A1F7X928_9BACT|nr:MAG: hypothetical protein A2Z22_00560 [Candidatus Woesebacteria bacterium RBG_16_34_12]